MYRKCYNKTFKINNCTNKLQIIAQIKRQRTINGFLEMGL